MEPDKISVSRDALRADLAELELRLKSYLTFELEKKASSVDLQLISKKLDRLDAGEFNQAQVFAIQNVLDSSLQKRERGSWTGKQRMFAFITVICVLSTLVLTTIYTVHDLSQKSNTPNTSITRVP